MKNLLVFLIFLLPFNLIAQEDAFGPQKNDNLIIVTTDTVNKKALEQAAKTLTEIGFRFKGKTLPKDTLSTDSYDYKKGKMTLKIFTELNEIRIYGNFEPNIAFISGAGKSKSLVRRINYDGVAGSPVKEAWNIMDSFANQLSQVLQGTISYNKWGD